MSVALATRGYVCPKKTAPVACPIATPIVTPSEDTATIKIKTCDG